jgi:copper/silver efflux system protein
MVGGMITSTLLTLVVIPAIYSMWKEWELARARSLAPESVELAPQFDGAA